ncbi:MAG: hypothetical protein WCP16_26800 [Pseudanabaena sp. ELA645]
MSYVLAVEIACIIGASCSVMATAPEYLDTSTPESPAIDRQTLPVALENLEQRARAVTVRVVASQKTQSGVRVKNTGSGILVGKQKATYLPFADFLNANDIH